MKLNDIINYLKDNNISIPNCNIWADFFYVFEEIETSTRTKMGVLLIDKLAGASDEVVNKYKKRNKDIINTAIEDRRALLKELTDLNIRNSKLQARIVKKNKQLANFRYRLKRAGIAIDKLENISLKDYIKYRLLS